MRTNLNLEQGFILDRHAVRNITEVVQEHVAHLLIWPSSVCADVARPDESETYGGERMAKFYTDEAV